LFTCAEQEIGILVYAALFLAEDVEMVRILIERARAGVAVRLLLGDPDSPRMAERAAEEGVGPAVAARVHNAVAVPSPAGDVRRGGPTARDSAVQLDLPSR
jgi:phosphatidylserine/phosphatidylglycerophosphate/cardiolipin synthase-like enzyme